ncbi:MAG TPA: hypothetical protein VFQ88_02835 [Nevskiaceae bacterium]|nr:hypothetical protein [Nevskiaceae bacterium]
MTTMIAEHALAVPRALQRALASPWAIAGTVVTLLILGTLYAAILAAAYTGGEVGLVSLQFLTPGLFALAFVMAVLLSLTLALGVYGFRTGSHAKSAAGTLGAVIAVLPSLLCCSPALPMAIAALAAVLPAAGHASGLPVQGWMATHEGYMYGAAIVLMAYGLYANAQRIMCCRYRRRASQAGPACTDTCCEPASEKHHRLEPVSQSPAKQSAQL